jgi:hypothetical protein
MDFFFRDTFFTQVFAGEFVRGQEQPLLNICFVISPQWTRICPRDRQGKLLRRSVTRRLISSGMRSSPLRRPASMWHINMKLPRRNRAGPVKYASHGVNKRGLDIADHYNPVGFFLLQHLFEFDHPEPLLSRAIKNIILLVLLII